MKWYGETHGQERLRSIFTHVPERDRPDLIPDAPNLGLIASQWYSASAVHAVLDHLTKGMTPEQREQLAHDGAEAIMKATLTGVYRAFLETFISPDRYAKNAQ